MVKYRYRRSASPEPLQNQLSRVVVPPPRRRLSHAEQSPSQSGVCSITTDVLKQFDQFFFVASGVAVSLAPVHDVELHLVLSSVPAGSVGSCEQCLLCLEGRHRCIQIVARALMPSPKSRTVHASNAFFASRGGIAVYRSSRGPSCRGLKSRTTSRHSHELATLCVHAPPTSSELYKLTEGVLKNRAFYSDVFLCPV